VERFRLKAGTNERHFFHLGRHRTGAAGALALSIRLTCPRAASVSHLETTHEAISNSRMKRSSLTGSGRLNR
jgi:hypothetical protein